MEPSQQPPHQLIRRKKPKNLSSKERKILTGIIIAITVVAITVIAVMFFVIKKDQANNDGDEIEVVTLERKKSGNQDAVTVPPESVDSNTSQSENLDNDTATSTTNSSVAPQDEGDYTPTGGETLLTPDTIVVLPQPEAQTLPAPTNVPTPLETQIKPSSPAPVTSESSVSSTSTPTPTATASPTGEGSEPGQSPDPESDTQNKSMIGSRATAFIESWYSDRTDMNAWRERVKPYVTAEQYELVEVMENLESTEGFLKSEAEFVGTPSDSDAMLRVQIFDEGSKLPDLIISMTNKTNDGKWRVSEILPDEK